MLRNCWRSFRSVSHSHWYLRSSSSNTVGPKPTSDGAGRGAKKAARDRVDALKRNTLRGDEAPYKIPRRSRTAKEKPDVAVSVAPGNGKSTEPQMPKPARRRSVKSKQKEIPARLLTPASEKHHDLSSFLDHAARTDLSTTSNVYKGTLFEYTVASALASLNFTLHRTGRSNDLGIDLVGYWKLPDDTPEVRAIVQCKALKPQPRMVRELEGAYAGAPAGWKGDDVLALLVSSKAATSGVRDALQRSRWPMGILQITEDGELKQFLWNAVAVQLGLEDMGVTARYDDGDVAKNEGELRSSIALTWNGRLWRPARAKT